MFGQTGEGGNGSSHAASWATLLAETFFLTLWKEITILKCQKLETRWRGSFSCCLFRNSFRYRTGWLDHNKPRILKLDPRLRRLRWRSEGATSLSTCWSFASYFRGGKLCPSSTWVRDDHSSWTWLYKYPNLSKFSLKIMAKTNILHLSRWTLDVKWDSQPNSSSDKAVEREGTSLDAHWHT